MSALRPSDLGPNLLVGAEVTLAEDVEVGANVIIHDRVTVESGARLEHGAVLGKLAQPSRRSRTPPASGGPTLIEVGATVCAYALVAAGARMGPHSFLGDQAHIREGVSLGADVAVGSGCGIGRMVEIGDRTRMQNHCVVGPNAVLEPDCFLGPGAQILTGRTMGSAPRGAPPVLRRCCAAVARSAPGRRSCRASRSARRRSSAPARW